MFEVGFDLKKHGFVLRVAEFRHCCEVKERENEERESEDEEVGH